MTDRVRVWKPVPINMPLTKLGNVWVSNSTFPRDALEICVRADGQVNSATLPDDLRLCFTSDNAVIPSEVAMYIRVLLDRNLEMAKSGKYTVHEAMQVALKDAAARAFLDKLESDADGSR